MNLANYVLGKFNQVINDPYTVKEVSSAEYLRSNLIEESEFIRIHKLSGYFDVILINRIQPTYVFRLCHLPLSKEEDARVFFLKVDVKLTILCKSTDVCFKLSVLQIICVTLRTRETWSPAHVAVEAELLGVYSRSGFLVEWLDSQSCDHHFTPLQLACQVKSKQIVKELLQAGVNLSLQDDYGNNAIHIAVNSGNEEIVTILCEFANPEDLCLLNEAGESPLHISCKLNKFKICKILLEAGADPLVSGLVGLPIHYALKYQSIKSVEALLGKYPYQVTQTCTKYGGLPLHWSKTKDDVKLLLQYNSPTDAPSNQYHFPLHIMVLRSRLEAAVAMILGNADVNSRGKNGNTALHLAVIYDHVQLVKMLLVFGADFTIKNDFGETAGLLAVRSNKPQKEKIVELLSCIGALTLSSPSNSGLNFVKCGSVGSSNSQQDCGFKVLCLDGGGIRGIVLTQILMALEKETGKRSRELFDWIGGTSTGGILAIGLAQGRNAIDVQRLYFRFKNQVFSGSRPYSSEPMEEFLKIEFGENNTMETIAKGPKVIVTATLADRKPVKLHLFRNYETHFSNEDFRPVSKKLSQKDLSALRQNSVNNNRSQLLWKAARSSGAAPTYFRPMDKFLDGGLVANNPTLDVMTEIHRYCKEKGVEMNLKAVVSLGTGSVPVTTAR